MVLVLDKPFLLGRWWKYPLAISVFQLLCWLLLIYKVNGSIDILSSLVFGAAGWVTWTALVFLPFALGRIGLRSLFWCGLIGFVLGDLAYFFLALFEPTRRVNALLPFLAFIQVDIMLLSLGIVIELGRYVYRKVYQE